MSCCGSHACTREHMCMHMVCTCLFTCTHTCAPGSSPVPGSPCPEPRAVHPPQLPAPCGGAGWDSVEACSQAPSLMCRARMSCVWALGASGKQQPLLPPWHHAINQSWSCCLCWPLAVAEAQVWLVQGLLCNAAACVACLWARYSSWTVFCPHQF